MARAHEHRLAYRAPDTRRGVDGERRVEHRPPEPLGRLGATVRRSPAPVVSTGLETGSHAKLSIAPRLKETAPSSARDTITVSASMASFVPASSIVPAPVSRSASRWLTKRARARSSPVGGRPAFATVTDIPDDVSLAVVAVPADALVDTIDQCIAKHVPGLRRAIMLPGCGHWTQQERPEEVNTALIGFLREL